jgi:hypothetical protein
MAVLTTFIIFYFTYSPKCIILVYYFKSEHVITPHDLIMHKTY